MEQPFTYAQVQEIFGYDAVTGNLLWKIRPSNRIQPGQVAGVIASNGRRYITIDGKRCLAHRLVWLHQKGVWPSDNVSPKNGDYLDTRIENLIEKTAAETVRSAGLRSTNKSGVKGVSWSATRGVWVVQVFRNYKTVTLGQFKELDAAIRCRRDADVGIFQSDAEIDEANKSKKLAGAKSRRWWANMVKHHDGVHGWASFDDFLNEVGEPPQTNYALVPIDDSQPIGPGNFQWSPPEFDRRTRDGRIAAGKSIYQSNYEMYRDKQLMRMFGISSKDYDEKHKEQGGICSTCHKPETAMRKGKLLPLCVDHDHATGAVRGLLCTACNIGIGALQDNPTLLREAADYIEKWQQIHASAPDKK